MPSETRPAWTLPIPYRNINRAKGVVQIPHGATLPSGGVRIRLPLLDIAQSGFNCNARLMEPIGANAWYVRRLTPGKILTIPCRRALDIANGVVDSAHGPPLVFGDAKIARRV